MPLNINTDIGVKLNIKHQLQFNSKPALNIVLKFYCSLNKVYV